MSFITMASAGCQTGHPCHDAIVGVRRSWAASHHVSQYDGPEEARGRPYLAAGCARGPVAAGREDRLSGGHEHCSDISCVRRTGGDAHTSGDVSTRAPGKVGDRSSSVELGDELEKVFL